MAGPPCPLAGAAHGLVPPLHARFLGAVYLSAGVMLMNGALARRQAEVRVLIVLVTIWTGALLVLSLFHLDLFDPHHEPVWFWFGAYVVYPVMGVWSLLVHRGERGGSSAGGLSNWARRAFLVQGLAALGVSALLLCATEAMTAGWPWKLSPLLARIYSAPFCAYGIASLLLARDRSWIEARVVVRGACVLSAFTLLASILHRGLFDPARTATWVWFAGFGIAAVLSTSMQIRSPRPEPTT